VTGQAKLAVLASGTGTNFQAILDYGLKVALLLVDRQCSAIEIAKAHDVPVEMVERTDFGPNFDRVGFSCNVVRALKRFGVTHVAMAGFMTILEKPVFDAYGDRILNTHPSLLPAFRGANAVQDALDYGVVFTGCTIHEATIEVDHGRILHQEPVVVLAFDNADSLHERIKEAERETYPKTIKRWLRGEFDTNKDSD
jgi:phosphoribosylglycinamide formyltransferase-1